MTHSLISGSAVLAVGSVTPMVAWVGRFLVRRLARRAVRLATQRQGSWRVRLGRLGEIEGEIDHRKRQRADAVARMIGHVVSAFVYVLGAMLALEFVGVSVVYAVSSAGFVGLAIALSCQDLIRQLLSGTQALLEDRYAVGDDVTVVVGGSETRGVVDLVGAASIRLRIPGGATWHAGHSTIDTVTNHSQHLVDTTTVADVPLTDDRERGDGPAQRSGGRPFSSPIGVGMVRSRVALDPTHDAESVPSTVVDDQRTGPTPHRPAQHAGRVVRSGGRP